MADPLSSRPGARGDSWAVMRAAASSGGSSAYSGSASSTASSSERAPSGARAPGASAPGTQAISAPQVKGLRIPARRTGSSASLLQSLSSLSFLRLVQDSAEPDTILALNVESRDIQKNPYLFSITYFRPQSIDVMYTLLPGTSPKTRRLDMLKYALNLLTLTVNEYALSMPYLYQLLESAMADLHEYVAADYDKLFSTYDALSSQSAALNKKVKELTDANEALAKDNYDLKGRLDELVLRVQSVERYSDSVLAVKIQEWLSEHNGEINLTEFCSVHAVSEARVEQVLNSLVSEGYLENRK